MLVNKYDTHSQRVNQINEQLEKTPWINLKPEDHYDTIGTIYEAMNKP